MCQEGQLYFDAVFLLMGQGIEVQVGNGFGKLVCEFGIRVDSDAGQRPGVVRGDRPLHPLAAMAGTQHDDHFGNANSAGAPTSDSMKRAAASRSSMLELKLVSANSPSLSPSPVKSNEKTAIPSSTNDRLIRRTALRSLEQVKQCAKRAAARVGPTGRSSSKSGLGSQSLRIAPAVTRSVAAVSGPIPKTSTNAGAVSEVSLTSSLSMPSISEVSW